jgi:hypothetical protein
VAPWPYAEYMARWERQVERRQLFLRSYRFSRDADPGPPRARLRLCFGWATRRRGFRYGRLSAAARTKAAAVCLC